MVGNRSSMRSASVSPPSEDIGEIMWAVALYEGEGSIFLNHSRGRAYMRMAVAMTNEWCIRRFHNIVGVGTVTGPYTRRNRNDSPVWVWRTGSVEGVTQVVDLIYEHLSPDRQDQMHRIFDFCNEQAA